MKTVVVALFLLAVSAKADEMPSSYVLANQGYTNCTKGMVFNNKYVCGQDYAQLFECDTKAKGETKRVKILAIGKIGSDVLDMCSPTIVFEKFIEAK